MGTGVGIPVGSIDGAFTKGSKQSSVRNEGRSTVLRQVRSGREVADWSTDFNLPGCCVVETVEGSPECVRDAGEGYIELGIVSSGGNTIS